MTDTRDTEIRDLQSQINSLSRRVGRVSKSEEEDWTWLAIAGSIVVIVGGVVLLLYT